MFPGAASTVAAIFVIRLIAAVGGRPQANDDEYGLFQSPAAASETLSGCAFARYPCWKCAVWDDAGLFWPPPEFPFRLVIEFPHPTSRAGYAQCPDSLPEVPSMALQSFVSNGTLCVVFTSQSSNKVLLRGSIVRNRIDGTAAVNGCTDLPRFWLWGDVQMCTCDEPLCNTDGAERPPTGVRPSTTVTIASLLLIFGFTLLLSARIMAN